MNFDPEFFGLLIGSCASVQDDKLDDIDHTYVKEERSTVKCGQTFEEGGECGRKPVIRFITAGEDG